MKLYLIFFPSRTTTALRNHLSKNNLKIFKHFKEHLPKREYLNIISLHFVSPFGILNQKNTDVRRFLFEFTLWFNNYVAFSLLSWVWWYIIHIKKVINKPSYLPDLLRSPNTNNILKHKRFFCVEGNTIWQIGDIIGNQIEILQNAFRFTFLVIKTGKVILTVKLKVIFNQYRLFPGEENPC